MPLIDEATFVLHGLDVDNRIVRADVFVRKLRTLLTAIYDADKFANGKRSFNYMITKLETHSAAVTIRQKQKTKDRAAHSGIGAFENAATAIYNGDRSVEHLPAPLVRHVRRLGIGVEKTFSHAEIAFLDNVIRIDDFLLKQSDAAYQTLTVGPPKDGERYYRGLATGTFDGVLKEIDARGTMLRGKLVLSAGNVEIDCVMHKDRVPEVRESFDKRVIAEGTSHYDGDNQLPSRLDVRSIHIVGQNHNLLRWRGAFGLPVTDDAGEDW